MWKIIFVECPPVGGQRVGGGEVFIGIQTQLPQNARRDFFFKDMPEDAGW